MAFFGEDGLQRQLKQAQRDLMTKDGQIASMHAVNKEQDETIKKLKLEVERVREENDEMARARPAESSTSEADSGERKRLMSEIKEVKNALEVSHMECKQLREEARLNSIQLHNNRMGTSPIIAAHQHASSSSTGRRRSTSLSADKRVKDLEAELTALRESAGSPAIEIDGLKTQLAHVRRDLNKSINEKMALEARARKDVEAVKSQLDDANFELDAMRRDFEDRGSVSKKEIERQKKAWDGEKHELQLKFGKLETQLQDRQTEIDSLRSASDEVTRLTEELDRERSAKPPVQTAPAATTTDSAELGRLNSEINSLRDELAQARAAAQTANVSAPATATSSDLGVRRLQRQLEKAQRDIEALEQSLDQSEEENQALRSRVPLPGSPSLRSDDGRVAQLEADNTDLRVEIKNLQSTIKTLRAEVQTLEKTIADQSGLHTHVDSLQADIEQKDALLSEAEQKSVSLSDRLEAAEASLAKAQASSDAAASDLASTMTRLEAVQSELQATVTQSADLEQALIQAKEAIAFHETREGDLNQSLTEMRAVVTELEARPSTASLEAELAGVRTASQQLLAEKAELEQQLSDTNKAKDDMVDVSSRLTLEINELKATANRLNEELDEQKDTTIALQSEVEQMVNDSSSKRAELENVNEQLGAALTSRAALETKIAELQDAISNRSTESEADARDAELSRAKLELHHLTTALSEKEQDLEREVRLLTFTKEQEQKDATARISTLQSEVEAGRSTLAGTEASLRHQISSLQSELKISDERVDVLIKDASILKAELETTRSQKSSAPGPSTPDRVGLLYAKIQSLRAERDELRQSLSFAQNESRFTISAAQADRRSALEELKKVKNEISTQTALHQDLEKEISAVRSQLDDKESRLEETKALFAGVTVDRGDVDDKISQYESEAAAAKSKQEDLVRRLQDSQQTIIELNHAMVLMRSNTETDKRHRKISMDRKSEMSMITETSSGIATEGVPASGTVSFGASRRSRHTRTRSEMAALILPDQAQIGVLSSKVAELETELKSLTGRLERRHATIGHLQRENEKLKMAQELNAESAEEFEELVAERDALQATLSARMEELEGLRAEVASSKINVETQVAKLAELEGGLNTSRTEAARHEASAIELGQELASVKHELQEVQDQRTVANTRAETADNLATESALALSASEQQVQSLMVNIMIQRKSLTKAANAWRAASRGLRAKTTALENASAQIGAFEAERAFMSQQLEAHTQRGKALDTANEKVRDLESQLEALQADCNEMAEQLDAKVTAETEMAERLDSLSREQVQGDEAKKAIRELEASLSTAQGTIQGLESDAKAVRAELSASEAARSEVTLALQAQIEGLTERLAASERLVADKTAEIETLNARLIQAEQDAVQMKSDKESSTTTARTELTETQTALAEARETVDKLEKTCDDLRASLGDAETKLASVTSSADERTAELEKTNTDLRRQLDHSAVKADELHAKLTGLSSQRAQLTAEVADLTCKIESAASDAKARQVEREKLESEVGRLETLAQGHDAAIAEKDQLLQQGRQKLEALEKDLRSAKDRVASSSATLEERSAELAGLKAENAKLQTALTEPNVKSDNIEPAAVADLRERIEELEASLMTKTQEVDEADDRTREAYKAKAKLEKKIAKLTRQLGEKESETTKSRGKVLTVDSAPTTESKTAVLAETTAGPAPAVSTHQRSSSGMSAARTPLRPVSHHEPSTQVPAATPTSLKRHRDVEAEEKPLPAEAIMLPPSGAITSVLKKTPARTSFTPKRNMIANSGAENARNLFGSTAINTAENRNIFAPRS